LGNAFDVYCPVSVADPSVLIQDDHILACAISAKTDYLVTGDNDLLVLGQFGGVKIVTPKTFEMLFA
jgi:predicted nucleic acid-binding protein